MSKPLSKLALHSHILPSINQDIGTDRWLDDGSRLSPESMLAGFLEAQIFDARALPVEFVMDTGQTAFEELSVLKQPVRLPFPQCYVEFQDMAIYAEEADLVLTKYEHAPDDKQLDLFRPGYELEENQILLATIIQINLLTGWSLMPVEKYCAYQQMVSVGWFLNGAEYEREDPNVNCSDGPLEFQTFMPRFFGVGDLEIGLVHEGELAKTEVTGRLFSLKHGAELLAGFLSLLNDKLLAQEVRPDPSPKLTKQRMRTGKLPLTADSRVVTLNLAAVRRATQQSRIMSHESPCLHWRRGHWRTLHRGSEFEDRAWVRRCLVGDPSRGFLSKDYRLTWQPSLLTGNVDGMTTQ